MNDLFIFTDIFIDQQLLTNVIRSVHNLSATRRRAFVGCGSYTGSRPEESLVTRWDSERPYKSLAFWLVFVTASWETKLLPLSMWLQSIGGF